MVKPSGIDRTLLTVSLLLIAIGVLMIFSTTPIIAREKYGDSFHFLNKQLLYLVLGLLVFASLILFRSPFYLNPRLVMAAMTVTFTGLSLVFFFQKVNNTSRWIRFGGMSIQPSEFAKITLVLYLAMMLSRKETDINNLKGLGLLLLPVAFMEGLILKEPDFGNFVLIGVITMVMLFVAGLRLKYFAGFFLLLAPVLFLLIQNSPMRQDRIRSFLNPEDYASTQGFQATQSAYAIGSGALRTGDRQFHAKTFLSSLRLFGFRLRHHRRGGGFFRRPADHRSLLPVLPARHGHCPPVGQSPHLFVGDRPGIPDRFPGHDEYLGGRRSVSDQGHPPALHLLGGNVAVLQPDDHRYHPQRFAPAQGSIHQ